MFSTGFTQTTYDEDSSDQDSSSRQRSSKANSKKPTKRGKPHLDDQLDRPSQADFSLLIVVAAPRVAVSRDESDEPSSSSSESSDEEFTTSLKQARRKKKPSKAQRNDAFNMPRFSSRNGKELPNYNEAAQPDWDMSESEGEYLARAPKLLERELSLLGCRCSCEGRRR